MMPSVLQDISFPIHLDFTWILTFQIQDPLMIVLPIFQQNLPQFIIKKYVEVVARIKFNMLVQVSFHPLEPNIAGSMATKNMMALLVEM